MARVTHGPKTRLIKHSRTLPFIVFIAQNLGLLHFTQPTIFAIPNHVRHLTHDQPHQAGGGHGGG